MCAGVCGQTCWHELRSKVSCSLWSCHRCRTVRQDKLGLESELNTAVTRCYLREVPGNLRTAVSFCPPCMTVTRGRWSTSHPATQLGVRHLGYSCMGSKPRDHVDHDNRAWLLTRSLRKGNKNLIQGDFSCPVLGLLLSRPWTSATLVTLSNVNSAAQRSTKTESVVDNKRSSIIKLENTTMHYMLASQLTKLICVVIALTLSLQNKNKWEHRVLKVGALDSGLVSEAEDQPDS